VAPTNCAWRIILAISGTPPSWFTVEQLDATTFAISEYGHWEETHAYLFIGAARSLLLDTGLGVGNIRTVIDCLTTGPVTALVSHAHWDHTGGLRWFADFGVHPLDRAWLAHGLPVSVESIRRTFAARPFAQTPPVGFALDRYAPFTGEPTFVVDDGDVLDLGDRTLTVFHTPGHSPGSISLYEARTGYLATGDLLYEGTLDAFYDSTDPVAFARSIRRLGTLPVTRLLPGHHRLAIPVVYLREAHEAFEQLQATGQLRHGTGVHRFDHLAIRL
jgi:glyoxylase-like metal-dependent hydrolase (beta-lactamase superfamily II)